MSVDDYPARMACGIRNPQEFACVNGRRETFPSLAGSSGAIHRQIKCSHSECNPTTLAEPHRAIVPPYGENNFQFRGNSRWCASSRYQIMCAARHAELQRIGPAFRAPLSTNPALRGFREWLSRAALVASRNASSDKWVDA